MINTIPLMYSLKTIINCTEGHIVCNSKTSNQMCDQVMEMYPSRYHKIIRGAISDEGKVIKHIFNLPIIENESMQDGAILFQPSKHPLKFIYKNF